MKKYKINVPMEVLVISKDVLLNMKLQRKCLFSCRKIQRIKTFRIDGFKHYEKKQVEAKNGHTSLSRMRYSSFLFQDLKEHNIDGT